MQRGDSRSLLALVLSTALALVLLGALPSEAPLVGRTDHPAPSIMFSVDGVVTLAPLDGGEIRYTLDGSPPTRNSEVYKGPFRPSCSSAAQRSVTIPTSVQWRHPVGDQPCVVVVRACSTDDQGRTGEIATRSFVPQGHKGLPVLSLSLPAGALFDPDTGLYVVGNAIFHTQEEFVRKYPDDPKWWKYPGNFHFRGKKAERAAHLEYFHADATPNEHSAWSADVRLRINGNNTRGFPQHALRVLFDEPLEAPLFDEPRGEGFRCVLLRSSGNDQDRTFFRDALQHRLCEGLPFETSACVQSVLYVNGAYWGLHNIRERLDDKEIARRCGVKPKRITILADRLELYEGDPVEVKRFSRFLTMAEAWDANAPWFVDSLNARMDVDGFLCYMSANIIFGNTDWPDQNGKWWRYTGPPEASGPRDGRWRFLLGDSDLSFGLTVGPDYDMFAHIDRHASAPLSRLYKACIASPVLRSRARTILIGLLEGPLSGGRMTAVAEEMHGSIAEEMRQHIRRWRRPLTYADWQGHVEDLLTFARDRGAAVRRHMDKHFPQEQR